MSAVKVSWRKWISQRVKIIDEYNRIPTKTQSALLSLMAEGYAEMMDQYVYAGRSSWFLTANDDQGGGTFQVIEALKDRIDVVVRAVPFNSGFIDTLLQRIEADRSPEEHAAQGDRLHPGRAGDGIHLHPRGGGAQGGAGAGGLLPGAAGLLPPGLAALRVQAQGHAEAGRADGGRRVQRAVPARQEGAPVHADGERRQRRAPTRRFSTSPRRWPSSAGAPPWSWRTSGRSLPGCCTRS